MKHKVYASGLLWRLKQAGSSHIAVPHPNVTSRKRALPFFVFGGLRGNVFNGLRKIAVSSNEKSKLGSLLFALCGNLGKGQLGEPKVC